MVNIQFFFNIIKNHIIFNETFIEFNMGRVIIDDIAVEMNKCIQFKMNNLDNKNLTLPAKYCGELINIIKKIKNPNYIILTRIVLIKISALTPV